MKTLSLLFALAGCANGSAVPVAPVSASPPAATEAPENTPTQGPTEARQSCSSSCSLADAPGAHHLSAAEYDALLATWATQELGAPTLELETLLFNFQDSERLLRERGAGPLDAAHEAFLRRELARQTVHMEMRLVDDEGLVRGTAAATIPLKEKQHIRFKGTGSLGALETGGKVKRVGLGHLWSRW